jgi:light-regulated signal transduction histidine kinase (bacteriophytochrome)
MNPTFANPFADDTPSGQVRRLFLEISRELQKPLRTIRCCAEVAEDKCGTSGRDVTELLQCVSGAAVRMQNLIDDALALALATGSIPEKSRVEMGDSLQFALGRLRETIEEAGATVDSGALPVVHANFGALSLVFQTLLANAVQYRSERPPRIQVDCVRSGEDWLVWVADNGIGIEREYREQIFLPLKRLHAESECPGTGLGLAICRRIIESHNGRIWVESEPGVGSTFYLTIPASQPDETLQRPGGETAP